MPFASLQIVTCHLSTCIIQGESNKAREWDIGVSIESIEDDDDGG
jgi:hypothetical protein